MRPILWLPFSCAVILTLSGCANMGGSAGGSPSGTGPFDSQGNYHEEWANDPSKWRKPGSHSQPAPPSDELPVVAKNEQPPLNASPFAAPEPATPKTSASRKSATPRTTARHTAEAKTVTSKPKATASKSPPRKTTSKTAAKAPAKGSRYTVKKGDTLYTIAEHRNTTAAAIRKANGLSGSTPKPGKTLVIPK